MNSSISNSKPLISVFVICVVGIFCLLAGASELFVRIYVLPQDTMARHVSLFKETNSPYAVFGDSHAARGFNAPAPFVNLAYPEENIHQMAWKAERYLAQVGTPKQILIQADPHQFRDYNFEDSLGEYPGQFSERPASLFLSLSSRYRIQLSRLWRSFFKNRMQMVSNIEITSQGSLLSPGDFSSWPELKRQGYLEERVALHQPNNKLASSRQAVMYRTIVTNFIKSGAEVCLVVFPTTPAYRAHIASLSQTERKAWRDTFDFLEELAQEEGAVFVDHRAAVSDLSLFRDPDHLNKEGAVRYSPILLKSCFGSGPTISA